MRGETHEKLKNIVIQKPECMLGHKAQSNCNLKYWLADRELRAALLSSHLILSYG